jgi:hypothetical protein
MCIRGPEFGRKPKLRMTPKLTRHRAASHRFQCGEDLTDGGIAHRDQLRPIQGSLVRGNRGDEEPIHDVLKRNGELNETWRRRHVQMCAPVPRHGQEHGEPGIELVRREVGKVGLKFLGRGCEISQRGLKE